MAREIKKFVKIQSSINVRVTSGLQYDDFTRKDSDIPNRLKVAPQWPKLMVMIQIGQHTYPAEIVNWPTVKALQKQGVLTVGEYTDEDKDGAEEKRAELEQAVAEIKSKSLSDIAGE